MSAVKWSFVLAVVVVVSWTLPFTAAVDRTPLRYRPIRCRSNGWSISETFQCDHFRHCLDGSDEEGCTPAVFLKVPPLNVTVQAGSRMNLTCSAKGVPTPTIEWKMNDKQPEACDWITEGGVGELSCSIRLIDSGNYTCVARQHNVTIETIPTVVKVTGNTCKEGYFNEAGSSKACLKCFCSGVSNLCQAADFYRWNYTMAMNDWKMKYATVQGLEFKSSSKLTVNVYDKFDQVPKNITPYYHLPFRFTRHQVGSYGEYFRYVLEVDNSSYSRNDPDIILQGYNTTLLFWFKPLLQPNRPNQVTLRFHESSFRRPEGTRASREDVMTVLAHIDSFLIRMYPSKGAYAPSSSEMVMDASTTLGYHGLGKVTRVELCRCPHGYRGTSCEWCDFGYNRAIRYLRTGICMPWEWHREEYMKVSTTTLPPKYHYV